MLQTVVGDRCTLVAVCFELSTLDVSCDIDSFKAKTHGISTPFATRISWVF